MLFTNKFLKKNFIWKFDGVYLISKAIIYVIYHINKFLTSFDNYI